jgi:hypothetical protein
MNSKNIIFEGILKSNKHVMVNWTIKYNIRKFTTVDILPQLSHALLHICSSEYQVGVSKALFTLDFLHFCMMDDLTITKNR